MPLVEAARAAPEVLKSTVLLDVPTNLLIGQVLALSAYRQIRAAETPFNRYFWRAMAYAWLVWVPVTAYYYYVYPGWSWVYLLEPRNLPGWVGPYVLSLYAAGNLFGFLSAQHLIRERRLPAALGILGYTAAILALLFVLTWDQYQHLGTVDEYRAGKAVPITAVPSFMFGLNLAGALLTVPVLALLWMQYKEGRGVEPAGKSSP